MDSNGWMFRPPAPDLARIDERLSRLAPPLPELIQCSGDALVANDVARAQGLLGRALQLAPSQPDVLRLYGLLLFLLGNLSAAGSNFEAAIQADPDDAMAYWQYAQSCEQIGNLDGAQRVRELAVSRLPDSPLALVDMGNHCLRNQQAERALSLLERAVRLVPDYAPAQLKLGDALVACGRVAEGAAAVRQAIAVDPTCGAAWIDLANIKAVQVTDAEVQQMRHALDLHGLPDRERTAIEFALARVYEDRRLYADAYALLVDANARHKRAVGEWDANGFEQQMELSRFVFADKHAAASDPHLGHRVIFIVGMPRSGTTLIEQILASHVDVAGAGELGDLAQVLSEESARRKIRYPGWVPVATAQDWQRLGMRYLELTERHRGGRPWLTDKMPNNWQAMGAIRAMLPGAHIVICRRDPLENCWSCFKQFFPEGWAFSYDIDYLARFWRGFDASATWWAAQAAGRVREQGYESLTENPEAEIRDLLEFCGLSFDPNCLASHQTQRSVQTLSASQVRQPIHRHAKTAAAYGAWLDPLRNALGIAPVGQSRPI